MIRSYRGAVPSIASSAFVEASAQIIGYVTIGEHSSVWFNAVIRGDVFPIRIGSYSNIQDGSILHVSRDTHACTVGDWVTVGHAVVLHGCMVGSHCLVGMHATVLDDVEIGEYSIVAAHSLVPMGMKIPPRSLVMGVPARLVRTIRDEDLERIDRHAKNYLEYKEIYLKEAAGSGPRA